MSIIASVRSAVATWVDTTLTGITVINEMDTTPASGNWARVSLRLTDSAQVSACQYHRFDAIIDVFLNEGCPTTGVMLSSRDNCVSQLIMGSASFSAATESGTRVRCLTAAHESLTETTTGVLRSQVVMPLHLLTNRAIPT